MNALKDHSDPRVSDAYRAIAGERTPEHLDKAVMRMAARSVRTPYASARAWMRPVGWAAIIGLSLAFILELTILPREAVEPRVAPAETPAADREGLFQTPSAESDADRDSLKPVRTKAPLTEEWRARQVPAKVSQAPAMTALDGRGDAASGQQPVERQGLCPADTRDTAERWYACIESLRETTPANLVSAELDELFASYPDFVVPEADK